MKIAVVGLWHLGMVTAACLAHKKIHVIGYDDNSDVIDALQKSQLPIFEPGLEDLTHEGLNNGYLTFTHQQNDLAHADIVWITYDTPVDDQDNADVSFVTQRIGQLLPFLKNNAVILISSQLPLGSTTQLQMLCNKEFPDKNIGFAYSPENLRLGKAITVFLEPDRIVVGANTPAIKTQLTPLLSTITENIVWMSVESAEMTKHAINAFLATSVVFINELATLCEQTGADAFEVEHGLKSEFRIGPRAYLHPGAAFAGGTLARDLRYLIQIGHDVKKETPLFSAVIASNQRHKKWVEETLLSVLDSVKNKTLCLLGLTYKSDTNTLRRSLAIETALWLKNQDAHMVAYDPHVEKLPSEYADFISLAPSLKDALKNADVAVVFTDHPEFKLLTKEDYASLLKKAMVIDPNGYLYTHLNSTPRLHYCTIGRSAHVITA